MACKAVVVLINMNFFMSELAAVFIFWFCQDANRLKSTGKDISFKVSARSLLPVKV